MDLRRMRYFVAVVQERSFLRAAKRLHISQPPLSTQIKELEQALGALLLDRTSKGVQPTPAGLAFYQDAVAILEKCEQAQATVKRVAMGGQGSLRIGFISIADFSMLPPSLRQFRIDYPLVDVQLLEMTTDAQVVELIAGRLDVGIALAPINDPALTFIPLFTERLMLALPAQHPSLATLGRTKRIGLKQLSGEPFVMVPHTLAPSLHDMTLEFCHRCGFAPRVVQYAKQMQTVISLVSSGLGVAVVPVSLQNLQRSGVTYVQAKEPSPSIQVGLVHRKGDTNPTIARYTECAQRVVGLN
jgi:DNA-binding transcriptional LysR family regulator